MLLETIADTKMPLTHNIPTSSLTASSQANRTGKTDTVTKANEFAATWIDAWNSHDLDRILALYSEDAVYSSSLVRSIGGGHSDSIRGHLALYTYFSAVLRKFPSLSVRLRAVYTGDEALILLCDSANELVEGEKIKLNGRSQIARVWVYYGRLRQSNPEKQATNQEP